MFVRKETYEVLKTRYEALDETFKEVTGLVDGLSALPYETLSREEWERFHDLCSMAEGFRSRKK